MTFARLVVKDLLRNPLRLTLTVLAAAVGVLAFAFLQTVVALFYMGAQSAQADRLIVRNKAGFTQPLPLAYRARIAALPGVSAVTFEGWFGGRLGDRPQEQFASFYVDTQTFLDVFDEFAAPAEQIAGWKADPCGAVAGVDLAERFGWKVGDRVTLNGTLYPGQWTFNLRGIYRAGRTGADTTVFAFGYRCLNEKLPLEKKDRVGIFALRVVDPARSAELATTIDGLFANSPYPTKTESERAFQLGFVAMTSAILGAVKAVSLVILLIVLLVVANTLAMGVREKTVDLATLKAMGFPPRYTFALVLFEAVAIGALASLVGILAAPSLIRVFVHLVEAEFGALPEFSLKPSTVWTAAAASVTVSVVAALVPALRAGRLPAAEALRRVA